MTGYLLIFANVWSSLKTSWLKSYLNETDVAPNVVIINKFKYSIFRTEEIWIMNFDCVMLMTL